jgi:hypothetical protein
VKKGKKKETGAGLALSNIVLDTESIPFRLAGESFKKKKESFFFKNLKNGRSQTTKNQNGRERERA